MELLRYVLESYRILRVFTSLLHTVVSALHVQCNTTFLPGRRETGREWKPSFIGSPSAGPSSSKISKHKSHKGENEMSKAGKDAYYGTLAHSQRHD